jgi:hypothetical protein
MAGPWLTLAFVILGAFGICLVASTPPAPRAAPPSPGDFSEPRARALVDHLSAGIGLRLNGTPGHRRAAELLASELRKIPGVEVELQEAAGTQVFSTVRFPPFVYRTLNVVARLPGRSPEAVLLDAHFDTPVESVGAADDAAGVAAVVETVRVLAREAPLAHTLTVNLNGAEEIGLLGAAGFLQHRWARDVRAYVYVEALPGGMTGLFGAGPGNVWLAKAYARAVPRPFGSSVGQDLVQAQLLPHNGDFTPYHEAGLAGLDMAMTGDGWAYHTMLDRTGRLQPGSLQHLGDSVLAITRALASAPLPPDDRSSGAVYYDLLGVTMAAYSTGTARALAVLGLLFAAAAIAGAARRGRVSFRAAAGALGWTVLATFAGLLSATAGAALVALGLGRPAGWFSAPGLVAVAFGAPAAAGILGVHGLWRRRALRRSEPQAQVRAALVGALLLWCLLLALAAVTGIGAGYLALWWTVGGALALLLSVRAPRLPVAVSLACLAPAIVLTAELAVLFLSYFIPITGMLGLGAIDPMIAALVALPLALMATLALPLLHATRGFGRAALGLGAVGAVGLALVAARFPFTAARPKRVMVAHVADGDEGAVRVKLRDRLGLNVLVAALPGAAGAAWKTPAGDPFTRERPAPPPPMPPPRAEIEAQERVVEGRRVTLRIRGTSPLIRLAIPRDVLVGWSLAPSLAATPPIDGRYVAQLYDLAPAGTSLTLTLRGDAPVEIELRGTDGAPPSGPEIEAVVKALPVWVTPTLTASRITRLQI